MSDSPRFFMEQDIPQMIREVLSTRSPNLIEDGQPGRVHAGVLIPLLKDGDEHKVLFTQRTNKVAHHKGQISFPGGKVDETDNSHEDTALREAYEEIGLHSKDVEVLGRIDDSLTLSSNYIVHPLVGFVPYPYDYTISRAEVERIITVPLYVFQPENTQFQRHSVEIEGRIYRAIAYEYNGDLIWGATARIMQNFFEIVGHKLSLPERQK